MACLDNIIGIARNACGCQPDLPEDYELSSSGYYLADIQPFGSMGFSDCTCDETLWAQMGRVRETAVSIFQKDITGAMLSRYQPTRGQYNGTLGEAVNRGALTVSNPYAGVRLAFDRVPGGFIRINRVGGIFTASGSVSIRCFNSLNQEVAPAVTLTTVAGSHATAAATWVLPLDIPYSETVEYFFVYAVNQSNLPRSNRLDCGCGGFKPYFNTQRPMWTTARHAGSRAWANWLMLSGWTGDDLTSFSDCSDTGDTSQLYGLTLDVSLYCSIADLICGGLSTMDFDTNQVAQASAYAVLLKASELMANEVLRGPKLSRATQVDREGLIAERAKWSADYQTSVDWIAKNYDLSQTGCLKCDNRTAPQVRTIFG